MVINVRLMILFGSTIDGKFEVLRNRIVFFKKMTLIHYVNHGSLVHG